MTTAQDPLNTILPGWYELLQQWSTDGSLASTAEHVLNLDGENTKPQAKGRLRSYLAQWSAGNFQNLPEIVLLPAEDISGAQGAYAASTDTIYLNEDWLQSATDKQIIAVLTEELGGYLDDQLYTVDTQGDEGALFSATLLGVELSDAEVAAIQVESDTITISVDGQEIQAEANTLFPAVFKLSSLDGSNGFVINGIDANDQSGWSVSGVGDVNGDGIDDLIIGAYQADPNGIADAGESYVVFGSSSGFSSSLELASLNGSNGFVINGIDANDQSGRSVSGVGDVNGDGIDDLIIGAIGADPNGIADAGESYVVFGSSSGFSSSLELASLNGSNGFVINGIDAVDRSGYSVSDAGDVNGDGIDDLIIGAYQADPNGNTDAGESYVVFGSSSGFSASFELASLNGSNGFVINGIDAGDQSGWSVSGVGDVNGDGIDDLIIGAQYADPNGIADAGESYVVFGSSSGFSSSLELSSLDGSNGFVINGIDLDDRSGWSVSGAGDVNGDGIDDLIIAASNADPNGNGNAGESYVVFGSSSGFSASLELASLNGSNGFVINGIDAGDSSGMSVSGVGDVNGDGIDDLIIGALNADPNGINRAGESYVVFGSSSGFSASLELSSLDGSNGFVINGIDEFDFSGWSVSGVGDVNGDGIDDLIIGAIYAGPNGNSSAGESYVIYGRSATTSDTTAPVFASGNTAQPLNENTGSNQVVYTAQATDDSSAVTYSIKPATGDADAFSIDANTGAVTLIGNPDYESKPSYSFTVVATDAAGNASEQVVSLAINDLAEDAFQAVFELSSLDGSNGFVINGIDVDDLSGRSVSGVGDVNGDGIDDLIIAAYAADPNGIDRAGESYVVFGSSSGFSSSLELSSLDGSNGFVINGIDANDLSGVSVSGAGDVNGDGIDDLIIGAYTADPNGINDAGESYVVFGSSSGFSASLELSSLDGSNGFVINGIDAFDYSGRSVSGAGDVNGDGIDDLIIGADQADPNGIDQAGESYVVFGSSSGFSSSLELASLDGSNGFVINGIDVVDRSGISVSGAGDVNGDGIDDLIIGAYLADTNVYLNAGESYVVFGSSSGFSSSLELASLDGSNGFVINGIDTSDVSGWSVSGAGDVNGDGIDDLIIGAYLADPNGYLNAGNLNAGESYVVFGSSSGFSASLDLASLDGSNGFVINGINAGDQSGWSVSGGGDVNGDGIDDLIIGAYYADPNGIKDAGESYVVFGSSSGFSASLDLASLDGSNGFVIKGIDANDLSGYSVSGVGDVNGDGIDDLIIGAYTADPNGNGGAGESYVVYGRSATTTDTTAPVFASGNTAQPLNENIGSNQVVYTAQATDDTSAVTYSIKPTSGDADAFSIDANTGAVTLIGNPDYESKPSYSFTVVATDAAGNSSEQVVSLAINDLIEFATFDIRQASSNYNDGDTTLPGDGGGSDGAGTAYLLIDTFNPNDRLLVDASNPADPATDFFFIPNYTTGDGLTGIGVFLNDGTGKGKGGAAQSDAWDGRDELLALITDPTLVSSFIDQTTNPFEYVVGADGAYWTISEPEPNDPTDNGQGTLAAISGSTTVGSILTAGDVSGDIDGDAVDPAYEYQWYRDGILIENTFDNPSTSKEYLLTDADLDTEITVKVTYTDAENHRITLESASTAAIQPPGSGLDYDLSTPLADGYADADNTTAELNNVLSIETLSNDDRILIDPAQTYLFENTGSEINIYLDNGEGGKGKNGAKTGQIDNRDDLIGRINDSTIDVTTLEILTDPQTGEIYYQRVFNDPGVDDGTGTIGSITGPTAVDEELFAPSVSNDPDGIDESTVAYSYRWFRTSDPLTTLGSNSSYVLSSADVGSTLAVEVTYTDAETWRKTLVSEPTAVITETLPPVVQTFTTNTDALTGQSGQIDEFTLVNLSDAKFPKGKNPVFDSITGFNVSEDRINAPSDLERTAVNAGVLSDLTSNDFSAALDATNFAANGAALLTFDDAGTIRTFLAINDSTDGFDNRRDAVIELINPVGDLTQMRVF